MTNDELHALKAKVAYTKILVNADRANASTLANLICELVAAEKLMAMPLVAKAPQVIRQNTAIGVLKAMGPQVHVLSPKYIDIGEKTDYYAKRPNYMSVPLNVLLAKKVEVSKEIDELRKIEGRRSNALALVADDVATPAECEQLVLGRIAIERLWDDYYFMERHGELPSTPVLEKEVDPEIELKKFQIDQAIESAKNIIYKSKKKLKDVAKYSFAKRAAIIEETEAKIDRYEVELDRLSVERGFL